MSNVIIATVASGNPDWQGRVISENVRKQLADKLSGAPVYMNFNYTNKIGKVLSAKMDEDGRVICEYEVDVDSVSIVEHIMEHAYSVTGYTIDMVDERISDPCLSVVTIPADSSLPKIQWKKDGVK